MNQLSYTIYLYNCVPRVLTFVFYGSDPRGIDARGRTPTIECGREMR